MPDFDVAVDAQAELIRWWRLAANIDYGARIALQLQVNPNRDHALEWAANRTHCLRIQPTYYVTGDLSQMVEAAGYEMPPEPFRLHLDLPGPLGFVYFHDPISNVSDDGKTYEFRAFEWNASGTDVMIVLYADSDVVADSLRAEDLGFDVDDWRHQMCRLALVNVLRFKDGTDPDEGEGGYAEYGRFVKAFLTISQQRLARTDTVQPSRSVQRRLIRAGAAISDVRVVTLRRVAHPHADADAPVEWSHRWLVSGHWRNQWLPSTKDHRLQWIPGYVKGPDDKPLVVKPTVYRVAR